MKEVWKTFLMDAPEDVAKGQWNIVYVATDGEIVGMNVHFLSKEQEEQLKKYYKDNYKP